jgi:hypothetical protein
MSHSNAHKMWTKAAYFAERAKSVGSADRLALEADIEAAIVFGRSALDHLQRQYGKVPDFKAFNDRAWSSLRSDPLCQPFLELRDFVIHEESAPIRKVITATVEAGILTFVEVVDVKVVRGTPWYFRRPYILWHDLRAAIVWTIKRVRKRFARRPRPRQPASSVTESLHFMDAPVRRQRHGHAPIKLEQSFKEKPALDVVSHWLDCVEHIVLDAESQFGVV